MPKIIDPDNLQLIINSTEYTSQEIIVYPSTQKIRLVASGTSDLTSAGVTLQCLYSFFKEEWKSNGTLIKYPFPLVSITDEQFELVDGWDWYDTTTKNLIRDGGWALKDTNGNSLEEFMNVTTLGSFNNSNLDKAYYLQSANGTPVDCVYPGEVNQAVKIYGTSAYGSVNYKSYFKIFLREAGKIYDDYDLLTEQNLTTLTYKKYALPLSNSTDVKITHNDPLITSGAAYSNINVKYFSSAFNVTIGTSAYPFDVIVYANDKTKEQIYEKVQYLLRTSGDIDTGNGIVRGDTASKLLEFIGDTLRTTEGVYISGFNTTDTNSLEFRDTTNTIRTYPYVAAGSLVFNDNLQNDNSAAYFMYFTNANGKLFGTSAALLVEDNSGDPVSGYVGGGASVSFDFDYDGNTQGGRTAGTDAAVTVVAIGLSTAQYFKTTSTLARSTANNISLVAALERNYSNPV
jgi:hypothetical protein